MDAMPPFDADLLRRYDRPGPRYTSYPTAPQFGPGFGAAGFARAARAGNDDPIPRRLSIYAHVPYCFSPCFYCGCNRIITRDKGRAEPYLQRLVRETALAGPLFDRDREVIQVHLGGGTPNFLTPSQIGEFLESLATHFRLSTSPTRFRITSPLGNYNFPVGATLEVGANQAPGDYSGTFTITLNYL